MALTKQALLEEALKRSAKETKKIEWTGGFSAQDKFINDESRYIAVQCSRRAGKTNGLAMRFFKTMEKYPKSQCLYLSLTQESARSIMWPILHEINDRYNIGCVFIESKLEMVYPNGARLKLMGADLKNFIKRLKGRKYPGVGIDEAQDMGIHLQSLIDDILTPSIADYKDGWLALTGTPGPVPKGLFFDITHDLKFGYSVHSWTMFDNPYMPNPQAFLADLKKRREWKDDNPTLMREWMNRWVLDSNSLWIRYDERVSDYHELPKDTKYNYTMGIDIGFNDADAICILAWSEHSPVTYLIEEKITRKQGLTELVNQVIDLEKKYKVHKMVIDEGGLGKKLAEEMRRRYGIPVEPADKLRKQENVELLNDDLRVGKFKAKKESQFAQDSFLVQVDWEKSTPNKIVVKKLPHSDIIDSVLYAYKDTYGYTHAPEPKKVEYGSKEWAKQQTDTMFEGELERMKAEQEYNNWLEGKFDDT